MPNIVDIRREIDIVRQELQSLKHCQVQYFTIAITGAGVIFGLSAMLETQYKGFALLAPLSLILPSWIIFFDKATSITRLVGYQRVLEEQLEEPDKYRYIGYENALAEFRTKEKKTWEKLCNQNQVKSHFLNISLTRYRYWIINWFTFLILSLICIIGAYLLLCKNNDQSVKTSPPSVVCNHIFSAFNFVNVLHPISSCENHNLSSKIIKCHCCPK